MALIINSSFSLIIIIYQYMIEYIFFYSTILLILHFNSLEVRVTSNNKPRRNA